MTLDFFPQHLGTPVDAVSKNGLISFGASGGTDYFRDPASDHEIANAPALLREAPEEFTFTVTMEPQFQSKFDAGAVFFYGDEMHWAKLAYEMTDRGFPAVVSVITRGRSDDCNGESGLGKSVRFRVSRKGGTYGMYYEVKDGTWMMHRLLQMPGDLPNPYRIGLSVQSPTGEGTQAVFSDMEWQETAISDFRWGT